MCDKLIKKAGTKEKRKEVLFMEMHKKLKFTEKLSYGIADLPEAANSIIAAFLTMFYTDNIGLAAAAVGTMFFISKLFDGISDILAGILIDKTRTKWGKARPWLLWLSVPTGLSIALIFFIPQDGSKTMQMIYAFVTYNLFTSIMFTITGIARSSLLALMTQDFRERGSMASFGMFFGLAGTILGCSLTFPLIFKLGGDIRAWRILFGIYGVIVTAGLLAVPVSTLFADGIDYGEYKTNRRIEGMGSAITSFSQKISSGLAQASIGWILGLTGYISGQAVQSGITNMGIISMYAWMPAALLLAIFIILKFCYKYEDIADEVINTLENRKKQARN